MLLGGKGEYCIWKNRTTGERHLRNIGDAGECTVGGAYWFKNNYEYVATIEAASTKHATEIMEGRK